MTNEVVQDWIGKLKDGDPGFFVYMMAAYGPQCERMLQKRYGCTPEEVRKIIIQTLLTLKEKMLSGEIQELKNPGLYFLELSKHIYNKNTANPVFPEDSLLRFYYQEIFTDQQLALLQDSSWRTKIAEEKKATIERILKAFQELDERCQQTLELFYLEDHTLREITAILNHADTKSTRLNKNTCLLEWREQINLQDQ